jgi:hypothetical protein
MTTETYILRALDADGNEFFYTGHAGSGWVSPDRNEAFTAYGIEGARRLAARHNEYATIHGYWFLAVPR